MPLRKSALGHGHPSALRFRATRAISARSKAWKRLIKIIGSVSSQDEIPAIADELRAEHERLRGSRLDDEGTLRREPRDVAARATLSSSGRLTTPPDRI